MNQQEYRDKLREIATEYINSLISYPIRIINLRFPWCLIYVLPREQRRGLVYLPDGNGQKKQNKTILEGIVLRVWKDEEKEKTVHHHVKVGNHVLFPHWAGWPMSENSAAEFRLVKEYHTPLSVHTPGQDDTIQGIINQGNSIDLDSLLSVTDERGLNWLKENYIIYPKELSSVTLSGN